MPFCRVVGSGIPRRQTGVGRGIGSGNRRPCLCVVFSAMLVLGRTWTHSDDSARRPSLPRMCPSSSYGLRRDDEEGHMRGKEGRRAESSECVQVRPSTSMAENTTQRQGRRFPLPIPLPTPVWRRGIPLPTTRQNGIQALYIQRLSATTAAILGRQNGFSPAVRGISCAGGLAVRDSRDLATPKVV